MTIISNERLIFPSQLDKNISNGAMPSTSKSLDVDESDLILDFSGSSSDNYVPPLDESDTILDFFGSSSDNYVPPHKSNEKSLKRWKGKNKNTWKRNIIKEKRSCGLPYITSGRVKAPKTPKPIDCSKCKYKCKINFNVDMRNEICR